MVTDKEEIRDRRTTTPAADISLNEEGYTAMLGHQPPWIVRWGIILFFVLLCFLLGITWFVRYPDRVSAKGTLMALNPPQELVVRTSGRLMHLLHGDGEQVPRAALLAVMETTADYTTILRLQRMADSLQAAITAGNMESALVAYQQMQAMDAAGHVGELQSHHQQMMAAMQTFTQYLASGYYRRRKGMLQTDLQHIAAQRQVLQHQWELTQQDVSLAAENFAANDKLAMQEVIAPVEHRNEQSKWLAKQLQLPQLEAARIANQVQHHEKQKEITQLDNDILQQQAVFTEALQQWRAALAAWQQQYIVTAPCSGRLVLSGFLQQGAALQQGQMLGSVQPANTGYFVAATLPHHNFGKLKAHQKALLRFSAYPYEEFGSVVGKLSEIKLLPTDSGYLAKIKLPQGLKTDHGRVLAYQQGLQVNVEILTDERRLLERLLDGLRKVTQR